MDTNDLPKILWCLTFVIFNIGGFSECMGDTDQNFYVWYSHSIKKNPQNLCERRNVVCWDPDTTRT